MRQRSLGSSSFETSDMKTEECLIFVKACMSQGADLKTANADMHMIDNLFAMKRFHFVSYGTMKVTWRGNMRKNQTLGDSFMGIIAKRASEQIAKRKIEKRINALLKRESRLRLKHSA